jgi:uncharacterized protein
VRELVFLDAVGLLAAWNHVDQWHVPASAAMASISSGRMISYTTSFVMAECGNAAARRRFRGDVDDLRLVLERKGRLILPSEDDWRLAWAAYRRGEAGSAGIVDHLSFVVMRRMGIARAFTNDKHFAAAGFDVMF